MVQPYLGLSNERRASLGYSKLIVTMADGEGWCDFNREQLVRWQSQICYTYTTVY